MRSARLAVVEVGNTCHCQWHLVGVRGWLAL